MFTRRSINIIHHLYSNRSLKGFDCIFSWFVRWCNLIENLFYYWYQSTLAIEQSELDTQTTEICWKRRNLFPIKLFLCWHFYDSNGQVMHQSTSILDAICVRYPSKAIIPVLRSVGLKNLLLDCKSVGSPHRQPLRIDHFFFGCVPT